MNISDNCMLVNLQISTWAGQKLDKTMTRKVTDDAQADVDAARVNKHLVPKDSMKEIVSAMGALRTHFYDKTLPWGDNGDRLLPRLAYTDFVDEHSKLAQQFDNAVSDFLQTKYLAARDQAEFRMGALFRAEDYPEPGALHSRFAVNLDVHGVPTGKDFRVAMDAQDVDNIRQSIELKNQDRLTQAVGDVWDRLSSTLNHFADKMGSDAVFRDSTVRNLEDIVAMLPALNITNDPKLEAIRQDILDTLVGYEPKDLRKDEACRQAAAKESRRIVNQMSGFMSAFKC